MHQKKRNFCIIAHIDHGKSTLADRLLEITHTVEERKMKEQLLDQMDLERERGITIKLQPVTLHYTRGGEEYTLHLIDTPGHVDFQYEVSRSLAAVEGAILLVDATKGVQAQTLANLYQALEQDLVIIPVVNKIDLPNAEPASTAQEIVSLLGCDQSEVIFASGKTGQGVEEILNALVDRVPPPQGKEDKPLRALIFDSVYDDYKGVIAYVRIVEGKVRKGERLHALATGAEEIALEVGKFTPDLLAYEELQAGDIGYIATGLKSVDLCRVGDTLTLSKDISSVQPLAGYRRVQPVVYASMYPLEGDEYNDMRDALEKLRLNDAAFTFEPESNPALGRGFRCGFLGMLHMEIIQERLQREFSIVPTITTPSVVYKARLHGGKEVFIHSPSQFPDPAALEALYEPFVKLEIVTPQEYLGGVMECVQRARGQYQNTTYLDQRRVLLHYLAPLADVIMHFHDEIKSVSQGFASFSYEMDQYRESDLVRLDILVAGERVEAFSRIVPRQQAYSEGKRLVEKLKEVLPRQNFAVALQAAIGGKIIARETIRPFRKDVTAKLYGGDVTRKRKLLEKQKKGKKRLQQGGKIAIPSEAFLKVLKRDF